MTKMVFFLTFFILVISFASHVQASKALSVQAQATTNAQALTTPSASQVAQPAAPTADANATSAPQALPQGLPAGATDAISPTAQGITAPVPDDSDPLLEGFLEDLQYNPTDKRDPFLPYFVFPKLKLGSDSSVPLEPLQKFALSDLKIVGIIWDVGHPKALILDPKGASHIVSENTKIGKDFGYIAAIREGEIIVVEPIQDNEGKKGYQTKILKLTKQI